MELGFFRVCLKVGEMKEGVVLYLLVGCTAAIARLPKWTGCEAWRLKLQPYMAVQQVQALPGDPVGCEVSAVGQIWY